MPPYLGSTVITNAIDVAVRSIPPLWPLSSSVAVNPFLGQTSETLAMASARLARASGITTTMPRAWYAQKVKSGTISDADLGAALAACCECFKPDSLTALKAAVHQSALGADALPTVADLASNESGVDWRGLVEDRFGAWAASYFDEGQALWSVPQGTGAYSGWRDWAMHDLTPEIAGLKSFATFAARMPSTGLEAVAEAAAGLGLQGPELPTYFQGLLTSLGGWAQLARYRMWQAELSDLTDTTLADLLAVRLVWESALYTQFHEKLAAPWEASRTAHAAPIEPNPNQVIDAILQDALERSAQRRLAETLAEPCAEDLATRPRLQAAFCIDVRSEVLRRALEEAGSDIQTLGFAGFFGLGTAHRSFASDITERRLPVLLNPTVHSCAGGPHEHSQDLTRRYTARAKRAWGRFKLAAVSSFAFVEATGPVYALKLVVDALGLKHRQNQPEPAPRFAPDLNVDKQVSTAAAVLRAMSLTRAFAPVVVLAGHGAHVVNNPHASALHCGACGGYRGDVNARLLAGLLNEEKVRSGLVEHGIRIPADTLFVGALHDTTGDTVTLYDGDRPSPAHADQLAAVRALFEWASKASAEERALKLPRATGARSVGGRGRDWAETRPEWALAGCQAFIAAPRSRTARKTLAGRAFLHDYDWHADEGFSVLELILTAPVVVASWISLQYYGSVVAPDAFGAGNKLLHNVVGGIGVLEGNGGLLRAGLPWQSVHDGEKLVHDPLRLSVYVEAPAEAISAILGRHDGVRALFDNRWLHLFTLDDQGRVALRYEGGLAWSSMPPGSLDCTRTKVAA